MHRLPEVDAVIEDIAVALGVQLSRRELSGASGFDYEVRLSNYQSPYGFCFSIGDDYQAWVVRLEMDESSAPLIRHMGQNALLRFDLLSSLIEFAKGKSADLTFRINGRPVTSEILSKNWESFRMELSRDYSTTQDEFDALKEGLLCSFSIVLCLVVDDESWSSGDVPQAGSLEGGDWQLLQTRYERSRYNRAICLNHYGFTCRGCGAKMSELYGPIGDGVIHVHHLVPLSSLGDRTYVDPIADMVPLCPNCHNIVHRVEPPMPIQSLNELTGLQPPDSL